MITPSEFAKMVEKVKSAKPEPAKRGTIKCASHQIDVVIGKNGLFFCPIETCRNSEANY